MTNIPHCIASLAAARDLMCTALGTQIVREQVVQPFGFVMVLRTDVERVGLLASWLERDRHESDKVLAYALELAALTGREATG